MLQLKISATGKSPVDEVIKEIRPIVRRETAVEFGSAFHRKMMRVSLLMSSYIGRVVCHRVFGCCRHRARLKDLIFGNILFFRAMRTKVGRLITAS